MMVENSGAAGTWIGTVDVKHGGSPSKMDSTEVISTTTCV